MPGVLPGLTREDIQHCVNLWLNIIIIFAVYPRGPQAHLNARTPTWLNQKGYVSEKINK